MRSVCYHATNSSTDASGVFVPREDTLKEVVAKFKC